VALQIEQLSWRQSLFSATAKELRPHRTQSKISDERISEPRGISIVIILESCDMGKFRSEPTGLEIRKSSRQGRKIGNLFRLESDSIIS
jgi:hypothetical protein